MADKVHPSKPNAVTTTTTTTKTAAVTTPAANAPPTFPPKNPLRHPYRPTPTTHIRHNHRRFTFRRCLCLTCFWTILLITLALLLAATASAAFYALYHPRNPVFSVTSLKLASFNLTTSSADDSTHLTTKLNVTLSVKNPNKKAVFYYDPMSISVLHSSLNLSTGYFSNFTSLPDSVFIIHTATALTSQVLDADSANALHSDLKKPKGLPLKIVMDTMVGVKMEKVKMKKIGIRVVCSGIHGNVPKGKNAAVADTAKAKCKVDLRIKILKWTF